MAETPTLETIYPNIDLKHFLKDHFDKHSLVAKTIQYIRLIPNFNKLRLDPELTLLIMNIIKSELPPNLLTEEIDIINTLIDILNQIFALNDQEMSIIKQQIIFLKNNRKVIGISTYKKILKSSTRWLTRKLG